MAKPSQPNVTNLTFEAIGTVWNIEIFDIITEQKTHEIQTAIEHRIATFDKHYSRFRTDSLIAEMAKKAGVYTLPADAKPMLDLYQSLYTVTKGAVTPLIGSALSEAGYDANYSLKPGVVHIPEAWSNIADYDFPILRLSKPALLDFGAAGKGYLVDIISDILTAKNIGRFCVNAGGDMVYRTSDNQKLDVGLEHPSDPTLAIGIAHIANQSLCGSSGNRRAWGEDGSNSGKKMYHHILSPHTLSSPQHIQALWVIADTGLLADGLATALFFTDAATLQKHYTFEYAIVRQDFSLERSPDFTATFFNDDN